MVPSFVDFSRDQSAIIICAGMPITNVSQIFSNERIRQSDKSVDHMRTEIITKFSVCLPHIELKTSRTIQETGMATMYASHILDSVSSDKRRSTNAIVATSQTTDTASSVIISLFFRIIFAASSD